MLPGFGFVTTAVPCASLRLGARRGTPRRFPFTGCFAKQVDTASLVTFLGTGLGWGVVRHRRPSSRRVARQLLFSIRDSEGRSRLDASSGYGAVEGADPEVLPAWPPDWNASEPATGDAEGPVDFAQVQEWAKKTGAIEILGPPPFATK